MMPAEIFKLTLREAILPKIRFNRQELTNIQTSINKLVALKVQAHPTQQWLPGMHIDIAREEEETLTKRLHYLKKQSKYLEEVEQAAITNTAPPPPQLTITDSDKEYIKQNTPIELVMGRSPDKLTMGKKWYRCPYHNEKTPSFVWNEDEHYGHCFGCDQSADIISLYQHIHGTTFIETLKMLI